MIFDQPGKNEITLSTIKNNKGTFSAYIMPENWIEDPWIKHDVATGFVPNQGLTPNLMSPGKTIPFYPSL